MFINILLMLLLGCRLNDGCVGIKKGRALLHRPFLSMLNDFDLSGRELSYYDSFSDGFSALAIARYSAGESPISCLNIR